MIAIFLFSNLIFYFNHLQENHYTNSIPINNTREKAIAFAILIKQMKSTIMDGGGRPPSLYTDFQKPPYSYWKFMPLLMLCWLFKKFSFFHVTAPRIFFLFRSILAATNYFKWLRTGSQTFDKYHPGLFGILVLVVLVSHHLNSLWGGCIKVRAFFK